MRRMLNTLFVTTHGSYLSKKGETIKVSIDGDVKLTLPVHTLDSIVCFGGISASAPLMQLCGENKVPISFLSASGRFYARLIGPVSGNVFLRRTQYRWADDLQKSAEIARSLILAKVCNSRQVLLRGARDHCETTDDDSLRDAARRMSSVLRRLQSMDLLDRIRACEGEAARYYFNVFDHLITKQKEDFCFQGRNRRPPLDPANAVMSFLYAVLLNDISSALESHGLDPSVGYLHRDRPGRQSLGLDLMEELRPVLADRVALSLINRKQLQVSDFRFAESGAVLLNDSGRRKVLKAYQSRKQDEIRHSFLDEKIPFGMVAHAQAILLSRYMRGDLDAYPPFIWR